MQSLPWIISVCWNTYYFKQPPSGTKRKICRRGKRLRFSYILFDLVIAEFYDNELVREKPSSTTDCLLLHVCTRSHCVKRSKYGVFSGPFFPVFGLNTEIYGVNLRIQSECRKIRTRKTPYLDTFQAVSAVQRKLFRWSMNRKRTSERLLKQLHAEDRLGFSDLWKKVSKQTW